MEKKKAKEKSKRKMKMPEFIILLVTAGALVVGGYYAKEYLNKKKPEENKSSEEVQNNTPVEPEKLKILDLDSKSRPYAVMINNVGTARPLQSGLQDAYIIYELIVEGGITRYLALFMDTTTERIGSIRSARHYFLDYALESDAVYVHHGQSPQAQTDFSSLKVDRIVVDNSKTGWRDNSLKVASEHTLFTSTAKLANGIGSKRMERNKDLLLDYSVKAIDLSKMEGAKSANNVSIEYSGSMKSSYEYDSETGLYKRSVNGKAHKDYVTGNQYTFKNIITYQVQNNRVDSSDRQDLENVGSGTGYYITNGYAVPITWSKSSRSAATVYKYESTGEEIKVNDGNTFIQIQPKNKKLDIS